MVCKRPGTAFLERVQQVGEILPCRLVLRRKACKIWNVVRLRTFSDKDLIAVRVAADKVLVDEEKRRVVLREGSPPFAAAVAAGPGTGCGERRPLPCRRLLSCRLRRGNCGFGRAVAGGSLVCGVSGRAAAINRACFIAVTAGGPPRISGICPPFGASVHWCGAFCRPARRGAAPRGPLSCASPARSSRRTGGRCRQRSRRR